ncbi:MAG: DinB family protein [Burkholderiaceae bacterium]
MNSQPYASLVGYKQWADRGLCEVVTRNIDRLPESDAAILLRILDHIHVVDRVFQHHLQGLTPPYRAARSAVLPGVQDLVDGTREVDEWYAAYVDSLPAAEFEQPVDFSFTNGTPACMTRGEILLHVCLHGTYHRGNAGLVLQKNGVVPNDDRVTDFLGAGV